VCDSESNDHLLRTLVTREGHWLTQDRTSAARLAEVLQQLGSGATRETTGRHVVAETGAAGVEIVARHDGRDEDKPNRPRELNVGALSSLGEWPVKLGYLKALLQTGTLSEQEKAIVEMIRSVGSSLQLKALQAWLVTEGLFDYLFHDLNEELWNLLVELGQRFGPPGAITLSRYVQLVETAFDVPKTLQEYIKTALEAGDPIHVRPEIMADVNEAVRAGADVLTDILDDLVLLGTRQAKALESLPYLAELMLVVELAKYGQPASKDLCAGALDAVGKRLATGVKGMAVLHVGDEVARRITWALIVETASWFSGAPPAKAAVAELGQSEEMGADPWFPGSTGNRAGS
jgi:hypothetical protein